MSYIGNRPRQTAFSNPGIWTPNGVLAMKGRSLWDPGTDQYRANVVLHVQPKASDTSYGTDSVGNTITLTNATLAGNSPFQGGASISGSGTSSFSVASNSNFNVGGAGQLFCFEMWFNLSTLGGGGSLFSFGGGAYTASVTSSGNLSYAFPGAVGSPGIGGNSIMPGTTYFAQSYGSGGICTFINGAYKHASGSGATSLGTVGLTVDTTYVTLIALRLTTGTVRGMVANSPIPVPTGPWPTR